MVKFVFTEEDLDSDHEDEKTDEDEKDLFDDEQKSEEDDYPRETTPLDDLFYHLYDDGYKKNLDNQSDNDESDNDDEAQDEEEDVFYDCLSEFSEKD